MNQPFLYDEQANVLRQKRDPNRSFGRADHWNTESEAEHEAAYEAYHNYMASLPAYTPVSGWVPEVEKEYVLNKHFELEVSRPDEPGFVIAVPVEQQEIITALSGEDLNEADGYTTTKEKTIDEILAEWPDDPIVFTLHDMIECWEAAIGDVNGTAKKQYFKSKGIDLP